MMGSAAPSSTQCAAVTTSCGWIKPPVQHPAGVMTHTTLGHAQFSASMPPMIWGWVGSSDTEGLAACTHDVESTTAQHHAIDHTAFAILPIPMNGRGWFAMCPCHCD